MPKGAKRMPVWSGLILAIAFFASMVSTASAASAPACDLEALRHYPLTDALQQRAIPLYMPQVFFAEPGATPGYMKSYGLTESDEKEMKALYAKGLATFRPEERQVVMLAVIDYWTGSGKKLSSFFLLEQGVYLDEVLSVLDAAGLTQHAALFREGRALFGKNYGTQHDRYYRWSDGSGTILDLALDTALNDLSARYSALPKLLQIAETRVSQSPELSAIFEPRRLQATDDQKLTYLGRGLWLCLNHYDAPHKVAARLARLPPPYARIVVVYIFEAEMLNGSVEQFFFNSSGGLAPDVVTALTAMGLKAHADAIQRGIDLFPKPYPRLLAERRQFMERKGETFSKALENLTGSVDDGAIHMGMIHLARQADILPK